MCCLDLIPEIDVHNLYLELKHEIENRADTRTLNGSGITNTPFSNVEIGIKIKLKSTIIPLSWKTHVAGPKPRIVNSCRKPVTVLRIYFGYKKYTFGYKKYLWHPEPIVEEDVVR